jgi:hypothetical protein
MERLSLAGELERAAGSVGMLAVSGQVAYLSRDDLTAVDFSDPVGPRVVARLPTRGAPGRLAVDGGRLFCATDEGIEVFDVSRPAAPRALGVIAAGDSIDGVAVSGERVIASDGDTVHCWSVPGDISGALRLGGCAVALCGRLTLTGDLVYVAADCEGMIIVDVARPSRPTRLSVFEGPGDVTRIAVGGDRALVADYTGGLSIVDVSNPRRPRSLGEWDEGIVGDVAARGDEVYLAMGDLVVLDIARPDRPRAVSRHATRPGDTAWNLELAGGLVCALGEAGLSFWTSAS